MRRFLAVLEGPTPREAVPILASEDQDLIRSVAQALADRLGDSRGVLEPSALMTGYRLQGDEVGDV